MAKREAVAVRIIEIVAGKVNKPKDEIGEAKSLIDDFGVDSLEMVEFLMDIEDEFNISLSDDEVEKLQTVGDAINYVTERITCGRAE